MWSFIGGEERRTGGRRIRKGGAGSLDEEGRVEADARAVVVFSVAGGELRLFFVRFFSVRGSIYLTMSLTDACRSQVVCG